MIIFKKLRWKNFLSTGNYFTEIQLDRSPNTLIIGSNGSGKSTMLDALTFVLFGKAFRKINKPTLINSINEKNCVVEIEFSIGKKEYKIIRGLKPNIFEIYVDGELLNQTAANKDYQDILEKQILRLNYRSFTQIVILGAASFTPFMQLTAADRRAVIEDLLDIKIFSQMHNIIKDKLSIIKDNLQKNKYSMDLTAEKIKMQKNHIDAIKKHNQSEIDKKEQDIIDSEQQIVNLQEEIDLIQKHINSLVDSIKDASKLEDKRKTMIKMESGIESNISKLMSEKSFFDEHDNCPTCKQNIELSFKEIKIQETIVKLEKQTEGKHKIKEEIDKLNDKMQTINTISKNIQEHQSEIIKKNASVASINSYIKKTRADIEGLKTDSSNLTAENAKLKELRAELSVYIGKQSEYSTDKHYYEYSYGMLKDNGIKTKIIKQYLPIMNKLINKYLVSMDSFINFNLDENFNETIKSRHRDDFSYNNFSEGEKQKIDFALLFTWRQIAKSKNSTNTNLLVLDEVFDSSLDSTSVELLMYILNEVSNDTNIFVISHKGDQLFDKFRSVISFEKKNNFSEIVK